MGYEITIRNRYDDKILRRWPVDDDTKSIREILNEARKFRRIENAVLDFKRKYQTSSIKFFWCPDLIPPIPQPPPPPEPIEFDALVNPWSV